MHVSRLVTRVIVALFFILPSPCLAFGQTESAIALTAADNGQSIEGHVGQKVVITLDENPSTGFEWVIANIDKKMLDLKISSYTQNAPSPPVAKIVGAGGRHVYVFEIKSPGTSSLDMLYKRRWETGGVGRFSISIAASR